MESWTAAFLMLAVCLVVWGIIELTRPKTLAGSEAKMRLIAFMTTLVSLVLGLFIDLWRIDRAGEADARRLEAMKLTVPAPPPAFLSKDRVPKPFRAPPAARQPRVSEDPFGNPAAAK